MQLKRFLLFFSVAMLFFIGWMELKMRLFPPPPPVEDGQEQVADQDPAKKDKDPSPDQPPRGPGAWETLASLIPSRPPQPVKGLEPVPPTPAGELIQLGAEERASPFHIRVLLDPRGAGVRSVVLNKFQAENGKGRPVWLDEKQKVPKLLELVPAEANTDFPSNVLYHYPVDDPTADRPLDTLGKVRWTVLKEADGNVATATAEDGRQQQRVSFQTEIQGLRITKSYTLTEGEYHLGLEVRLARLAGASGGKTMKVRYQLAGAHGLPVEGQWYTSVFRNALIAEVVPEKETVYRDLQDLRQISIWGGGKEVAPANGGFLRYAGVAIQYFASAIVVDDKQADQAFLAKARPTLEKVLVKGVIKTISPSEGTFTLAPTTSREKEETFYIPDDVDTRMSFAALQPEMRVAVTYRIDSSRRPIAVDFVPEDMGQYLFTNDITVRVTTRPLELQEGEEVVHRYLLYNGPVKPSLLGQMDGDAAVAGPLVDHYADGLSLNTMTDYHSPGWMGSFANAIYWTGLIIKCTNLMHWIFAKIHAVLPSYGLAIIVLTVLVRGMMFPLSRRQAMTAIKMQQLVPEMKKLQEKHKDDRQALGMAQMELYRKHGVNPFGTCWLLLLQMPIFMGLYFALQESIFFRLASFWPTWIVNLAAPDMLFPWSEHIPLLSRPEDYGGLLYLGPYFNILPLAAVALMLVQQKMMTPPPTDDQQAAQQKMMKYMMIVFGLFFYKVAAGLCLYFVASTLWGVVERRLLPKTESAKAELGTSDAAAQARPGEGAAAAGAPDGRGGSSRAGRPRKGGRERGPQGAAEEAPAPSGPVGKIRGWWRARRERISSWWSDILEQAKKK